MVPALIGLAAGAMNIGASAYMQDRQNEQTRANMHLASNMSMDNVEAQPIRLVRGLKNAGLNPALASQSGFSSPSVSSHPGAAAPSVSPFSVEAVQAYNQSKLADAEARKVNAEASALETRNRRELDEDLTYDANIVSYLKQSNSPYAKALLSTGEMFSKGTFDSIKQFEDFKTALDEADTKRLANEVSRLVATAQKNSPYYSAALADLPYRQVNQIIYATLKLQQESANLVQERDVNDARIKEIMTNIALMSAGIDEKNFNNVVRLWKTRDYQALIVKGVQEVLGIGGEAAKAYTFGKVAAGSKALKALNAANQSAPQIKGPFPHPQGWQRY